MLIRYVLRKLTIIGLILSTFTIHTMKRTLEKSKDTAIEKTSSHNTTSYFDLLPSEICATIIACCCPKTKNTLMRTNKYFEHFASKENYAAILLKSPLCLSTEDQNYYLISCLHENKVDMFRNLLFCESGADITILSGLLLYLAITRKDTNIARLLIEETNLDVNKCVGGYTPLQRATQEGCTQIVQFLLNHTKINTSMRYKDGFTLCHIAAENGHVAIMKLLIDYDETLLNKESNKGFTPLYIAAEVNQTEVVKFLLGYKEIHVNAVLKETPSPLLAAAYFGNHEVVRLLLTHQDILINASYDHGCTALFVAAQNDQKEVVSLLLKNPEINVNIPCYGSTPIHQATSNGHTEIIQLFIAYDNNLIHIQTTKNAFTPLHMACLTSQFDAASVLLQAQNININALDNNNETPLDLGLKNNHLPIIELLISKGGISAKEIQEQKK